MNIYQRIILVIGAIALIVVIVTTPSVVYLQGGTVLHYNPEWHYRFRSVAVTDYKLAFLRGFYVLAITGLLFLAVKTKV